MPHHDPLAWQTEAREAEWNAGLCLFNTGIMQRRFG